MKKRILITGATGLIGKEALPYLLQKEYEVYALTTKRHEEEKFVNWLQCDICDNNSLKQVFREIKPEYLLHFAWITGGDYLTNTQNIALKDAGINLLKCFKENDGKRAIYAGTCFEYDLTGEILKETTKLNPKTLYAQCKNELREYCEKYAQENNLSFGWGRIFYVYGHKEKSTRLTASIIDSLKNNTEFYIGSPNNQLDYMYTKDIAQAFIAFLESSYEGSVNICTGQGVFLKDYALKIQEFTGKEDLIKFDNDKKAELKIIGDNTILKTKIGFIPQYSLGDGLKEILSDI